MNSSISKTKFSHILLLRFENINYNAESNLKYLEANKLDFIINLEINSLKSNFTYEIVKKSNS